MTEVWCYKGLCISSENTAHSCESLKRVEMGQSGVFLFVFFVKGRILDN